MVAIENLKRNHSKPGCAIIAKYIPDVKLGTEKSKMSMISFKDKYIFK